MVTGHWPAVKHCCPLVNTKLYCLGQMHVYMNNLPKKGNIAIKDQMWW